MTYEYSGNYKYIASGCKSLQDMIDTFRCFANQLEEMQNDGLKLSLEDGQEIDAPWFFIHTEDKVLAEKHGFDEAEEWDEECECGEPGCNENRFLFESDEEELEEDEMPSDLEDLK